MQDEHEYQIENLGNFEVDRSMSEDLDGINKEQSVDFSEGHLDSDFDREIGEAPPQPVQQQVADVIDQSYSDSVSESNSYSFISEDSSLQNQMQLSFSIDENELPADSFEPVANPEEEWN